MMKLDCPIVELKENTLLPTWECWWIWICQRITERKHFNGCSIWESLLEAFLKVRTSSQYYYYYSTIPMTISICFTTFHWILPKNENGFGFDMIPRLKDNTFVLNAKKQNHGSIWKISNDLIVTVAIWKIS